MTEGRRFLIVLGVTAIVVFLLISPWSPLRTSTDYVAGLEGMPNTVFICDGSTHADSEVTAEGIPACGAWGVTILRKDLEYPDGLDALNVKRLEMEQALWGFVDQCTVTAYVRRTTFEQEVPCWDDSLSEPFPD